MRDVSDLSEIKWIEERLFEFDPVIGWKYGHVIPTGFDAYCKILPSLYNDLDVTDQTKSWGDFHFRSPEGLYIHSRDVVHKLNFHGQRMLWKQLAGKNGISYTHQVMNEKFFEKWPVRLVTASEGEVDFEVACHLARVFSQWTNEDKYYFSYAEWNSGLRILEGNLSDGLFTVGCDECVPGNYLYWWAPDKSWCVGIYGDSDYSLCGASANIINALLADPELECFRIDITDKNT